MPTMTDSLYSLQPKIAVQVARSLINYGQRYAMDRMALLEASNLSEDQLNDARLLVDVVRYEAILKAISEHNNDENLGFHFGQNYDPDRWGVLGYIANTSSSIMAAMAAQYRFQSLSGNMGAPLQFTDGQTTTVQWVPAYNCSYHLAEQIVTGLISLSRLLINEPEYAPQGVYFTHDCQGDSAKYVTYFGCPVHFNAQFNGLEISNQILQQPLRKADVEINKLLIDHAESLLAQQTFTSPMEVIKDYVIKNLPSHVPDIEEIAAYLNLSVRSTQRKLQDFGTSYSLVLDGIRKELALTYLRQTQNSMLYVSERLGFSEQSAFQRAFKRWTGTTPRRYRSTTLNTDL